MQLHGLPLVWVNESVWLIAFSREQARTAVEDRIETILHKFNIMFLCHHTGLEERVIEALVNTGGIINPAIRRSIIDWDLFVDEALIIDDFGFFLNTYDGSEHKLTDLEDLDLQELVLQRYGDQIENLNDCYLYRVS